MTTLTAWATGWLTRLVAQGGAHGPGSRRTITITRGDGTWGGGPDDEHFTYLFPDGMADAVNDLPRALNSNGTHRVGWKAIVLDRQHDGTETLWIDAVAYEDGNVVEWVRLTLPYRKRWFGRTSPLGDVCPAPSLRP